QPAGLPFALALDRLDEPVDPAGLAPQALPQLDARERWRPQVGHPGAGLREQLPARVDRGTRRRGTVVAHEHPDRHGSSSRFGWATDAWMSGRHPPLALPNGPGHGAAWRSTPLSVPGRERRRGESRATRVGVPAIIGGPGKAG